MRILLIQHDFTFCKTLEHLLEQEYQIDIAENLEDGRYFTKIRNYELIIMDFELSDSLSLIHSIKKLSPKTNIIITTSSYNKATEISSLQNGADDFLTQPMDSDVLLARIQARLKLWERDCIELQDLSIFPKEERVIFREKEIEIKGKALEILIHLVLHKNETLSKEELLNSIWAEPELVTPNVIEVAINQIRQKLDKTFGITSIQTIRKKGYRFCYPL